MYVLVHLQCSSSIDMCGNMPPSFSQWPPTFSPQPPLFPPFHPLASLFSNPLSTFTSSSILPTLSFPSCSSFSLLPHSQSRFLPSSSKSLPIWTCVCIYLYTHKSWKSASDLHGLNKFSSPMIWQKREDRKPIRHTLRQMTANQQHIMYNGWHVHLHGVCLSVKITQTGG